MHPCTRTASAHTSLPRVVHAGTARARGRAGAHVCMQAWHSADANLSTLRPPRLRIARTCAATCPRRPRMFHRTYAGRVSPLGAICVSQHRRARRTGTPCALVAVGPMACHTSPLAMGANPHGHHQTLSPRTSVPRRRPGHERPARQSPRQLRRLHRGPALRFGSFLVVPRVVPALLKLNPRG